SELSWLFSADQRPSIGVQQRYRRLDLGEIDREPVDSAFGEMLVFRRVQGVGLPIESALTLTDAVRTALLSNAGRGARLPDLISGHGSGAHCAVLGLPFIGS